ncbi:MAG: adenylate kinase [candidate division WOR-3 bacterium]|nr:MAG: adenylate kinase [candidate division WOR-3 bacterium]
MNLVLLGPPGSGKGTQAELLRDELRFQHYSTGEVFRDHIKRKTTVGLEVEEYVISGRLVPDEVVLEVVNAFLAEHAGKPVVFDGFPRTIPQAEGLDQVLGGHDQNVDCAVLIDLSDEEVVKRLTSRRQCRKCRKIYNLYFMPPEVAGKCDECGGELYQRDDDKEETIRDRLGVYHSQTEPLVEFYQDKSVLERIPGEIGRDRVFTDLKQLIGTLSPDPDQEQPGI